MKKINLAKHFSYLAILALATSVTFSCKKAALTEQSAQNAMQNDLSVERSAMKSLYVSAADTASLTKNLWMYGYTSGAAVDSGSFTSNAKDGNGIYYNKAKNEVYQLSRKSKTLYVFANATNLSNPLMLTRSFTDSTLSSGREITYDKGRDILYIANNSDSTIRVYKNFSSLSGNVTGTVIKIQGQPWGIFYDATVNSLIAVIDMAAMRLDIFDRPNKLSGSVTASRSLNITNRPNGTFSRLHGLTYNSSKDMLVVTEIGEATAPLITTEGKPAFNADGGIYIINNASAKLATGGSVTADAFISGAGTLLGNPVDIDFGVLNGVQYIFVAEKANKRLLSFKVSDNGNTAPTMNITTSYQPEAISAN